MTDEQSITDAVAAFLAQVQGPEGGLLRDSGRIQNWKYACGRVQVDVLSRGLEIPQKRKLDGDIYNGLLEIEGVNDVIVNMVNPDAPSEVPSPAGEADPEPAPSRGQVPPPPPKQPVPGVGRVIAIASGKGGVGKSTIAVNLAVALTQLGHRVGLLDADCYGPSIPTMLGIGEDEKPTVTDERKIKPIHKWDLEVMSIGFFIEKDSAVIWRGLMVTKALQQFFFDVAWDGLDYLILDLPPGTGDTQLTMVQSIEVHGAIIVSTPQDVALADARKGLAMFRETGVRVVGMIENMSHFSCPHCGERTEVFAHGGAKRTAVELGSPFLGEIPLLTALRETSDRGEPFMADNTESAARSAFLEVARAVCDQLPLPPAQGAQRDSEPLNINSR
jgi:ATP-binding protein involved in chromosome partitioning